MADLIKIKNTSASLLMLHPGLAKDDPGHLPPGIDGLRGIGPGVTVSLDAEIVRGYAKDIGFFVKSGQLAVLEESA